ncbi:hypothetical protein SCP_0901790 [Sparassis crispa]|uniref:Aip3p/Bud6 N-terminal domain-containing protein n=1 Tax=Sparassis crispa TaxID=139825 RepID=A0A401GVS8_9APHY|nr:hypothetical protein SCP_0901790 [Sparassis crispa]GBE86300.1 hypothetical protein SCP_0901790 [Sparassis crispa]
MVRTLLPYRSQPQDLPAYSPIHTKVRDPRCPQPAALTTVPASSRYSYHETTPSPTTPTPPRSPVPFARPQTPSDVLDAVSRLLALTKQLQEVLHLWGLRQAREAHVSDAFVLLGAQFNTTVILFWQHNVDISDLFHLIVQLRTLLERCLGEEPSPAALARYTPAVRRVVYDLLQGLRSKQQPFWAACRRTR